MSAAVALPVILGLSAAGYLAVTLGMAQVFNRGTYITSLFPVSFGDEGRRAGAGAGAGAPLRVSASAAASAAVRTVSFKNLPL